MMRAEILGNHEEKESDKGTVLYDDDDRCSIADKQQGSEDEGSEGHVVEEALSSSTGDDFKIVKKEEGAEG